MWVRGNSAEPGARDSDSCPDYVTGQGPFSLWASAMGRGTHPAFCVPSQGRGEVQRQPWIEKLSKLASPTASGRGGFLLIWQSGAWAWLCDLEQRLCFSGLSLPIYTVGMGGGWTLFPKQPFPLSPSLHSPWTLSLSLLVALDVRPLWLPTLSPVPSTAWLSRCLPHSFCLSLSPPPSLPLLSCWALAFSSLLCVSGPPLQPHLVHIQMAAQVLCPLPTPTQVQGTRPCRELPVPISSSPSSSLWGN